MPQVEVFKNRLRKNARHFAKWAKRRGLTAYRIYDRDIPEFSYAVDWYDGRVQLAEFPRRRDLKSGTHEQDRAEVVDAVKRVLEVSDENLFLKTHTPQPWGERQYGRAGEGNEKFVVTENGLQFWVNLGDYLDTGLFMDHRDTRERVRKEAKGKRFLNLFAYTGAFTVYAAAGGASETTTVDLSNTYCDWAQENLELNGLWDERAEIVRADVLEWLEWAVEEKLQFDLVVLDPPSFSASKKMKRSFDVQRDQVRLLENATSLLSADGVLYFSTNFQGFELRMGGELRDFEFEELTPGSIPEDFHFKKIHRCWRITRPTARPPLNSR